MRNTIEKYINSRYNRWLDYSQYHCTRAGLADEAVDVLNEVLLSVLQKDIEYLYKLFQSKKGGYTELDFYILQSIKLNAISDTAPYRAKKKCMPIDSNVDWQTIEIADITEDQYDQSDYILKRMNDLRNLIEKMYLGPNALEIFEFKFFQDGDFKNWPGKESQKELYQIYSSIRTLLKKKTNGELIF